MNETEGRRIFFDKWRRVREDERNTSFDEFSPGDLCSSLYTHSATSTCASTDQGGEEKSPLVRRYLDDD